MKNGDRSQNVLYTLTVLLSAVLLFQVQPLLARYLLPWFGGGASVWTACMLFFQASLLLGYAYAHSSFRHLTPRVQALVQCLIVAGALAFLPITPSEEWKPASPGAPTRQILLVLAVHIGLPYLALSATGPLIQGWYSTEAHRTSPYRLYAVSNFGSLLALLTYPFFVEPAWSREFQASVWGNGFLVFAVLMMWSASRRLCGRIADVAQAPERPEGLSPTRPPVWVRAMWICLAAMASILLLGITNQICLDVAPMPFLWILPLVVYLASFVLCFSSERWYSRPFWTAMLLVSAGTANGLVLFDIRDIGMQLVALSALLLSSTMVCHGELYRLRPGTNHLTRFYLSVASGGALGGVFVAIFAPLIFPVIIEVHLGVIGCGVCLLVILLCEPRPVFDRRSAAEWTLAALATAGVSACMLVYVNRAQAHALALSRNFYGTLAVVEHNNHESGFGVRELHSGRTIHGYQILAPFWAKRPAGYYAPETGIGRLMSTVTHPERRIGIIGMGTGALAAYGRHGDTIRFYEIDTAVVQLAREYFSYLENSEAQVEIVIGDGRLSMEAEPARNYDIIALDAFTDDAIPVHLLTQQAIDVYMMHLRPGGVIAVHISNRSVDLTGVLIRQAERIGAEYALFSNLDVRASGIDASDWFFMTRNGRNLPTSAMRVLGIEERYADTRAWTDEHASLFEILK